MTTSPKTRYWVNIVAQDHVQKGVEGGFVQASGAGKEGLEPLSRGDHIVFYSPRTKFRKGQPLQKFTALGQVQDGEPHRVTEGKRELWRCHVEYSVVEQVSLKTLAPDLDFITDKENWQLPFRQGLFEIGQSDFSRIAEAMAGN